jgi:hypothetical protein
MATSAPPRMESIEIPDRPAVASHAAPSPATRKRIFLYGGIAAAALLVVVMMTLLWSGKRHEVARAPADAPLIKAEDQPIKVSPESPGGMDVPNRDILVYGRMHGTPGDKPAIERLLPEPEQPLAPPAAPPRPAHTGSAPVPLPAESPLSSGPAAVEAPPVPGTPLATNPSAATPSRSPETPPTKSSATAAAPATKSAPASQVAQAKIPAAPATAAKPAQPGKPVRGSSVQVQLFSSRSADEARSAWASLKEKNGDLLGALSPTVARADLDDRGTFYRLRAGPIADEAKARAICDSLAGRGMSCIIIRPGR